MIKITEAAPCAGARNGIYIQRVGVRRRVRSPQPPPCLIITDSRRDSKFPAPRLIGLSLLTWPLFDMRPFRKVVRETAIQHLSPRPWPSLAYLPLVVFLAFLISDITAACTAVCGESTGGNSNTATYRRA